MEDGKHDVRRRCVYVTYDGLEDPLGQSQVVPYVVGLGERGHQIHVISFEKRPAKLRANERLAPNVTWTALRYHKAPTLPATLFDMGQGLAVASALRIVARAELLH